MTLVFGSNPSSGYKNALYVASAGWSVYLSKRQPCTWNTTHFNALAAMYAGALAVGEIYKIIVASYVNTRQIKDTFAFDLVTHGVAKQPVLEPSIPGIIHFDNLTLIGCGAIGQAFIIALMSSTKILGSLTLIDGDLMDASNEQRYLLGYAEHRGTQKSLLLQQYVTSKAKSPVMIMAVPQNYEQIALGTEPPPLGGQIVVGVDNADTRINVQASLPKILWNIWTDASEGSLRYGMGRHTLEGPYECMACSYFPTDGSPTPLRMASLRTGFPEDEIRQRLAKEGDKITQADIDRISASTGTDLDILKPNVGKPFREILHGECGVFRLPFPGRHESTPAPHQPALAGIFAASQIILSRMKNLLPESAKLIESSADFDAILIPTAECLMKQQRNDNCFCADSTYMNAYREKWLNV